MKYIAKYAAIVVDPIEAKRAHESEYYRTPHGWINGKSLGSFRFGDGESVPSTGDKWLDTVVGELVAHLKSNAGFTKGSIEWSGTFCSDFGPGIYGLEIGAGYTAFLSMDGTHVLAESYVACSGNAVVIIHKEDESVLYVNSRRHGIPTLVNPYMAMHPHEVVMYDSLRADARWYESGLSSPVPEEELELMAAKFV